MARFGCQPTTCPGREWQGGLSTENPRRLRVWHESASPHITGQKSRTSRLPALFLATVCLACFPTQFKVTHVVPTLSNHSRQVQWMVFREGVQTSVLSRCLQRPAQAAPGNDYDRSQLVCKVAQVNELTGKTRKSFEGSSSPKPRNPLHQLALRHTLGLTQQKLLHCSRTTLNSAGGCFQGGQGPELERAPGWHLTAVWGSG